jgi:hypothetical protein
MAELRTWIYAAEVKIAQLLFGAEVTCGDRHLEDIKLLYR